MVDPTPPDVLDIEGPEGAGPEPRTIPEWQEWVRRFLAIALVTIFGVEALGGMVALWLCSEHLQELKDILTLILGPTVALAGSATGFYFARAGIEP